MKFSKFLLLPKKEKAILWEKTRNSKNCLIDIVCFCLMPNHFHFLLRQKKKDGIRQFISQVTNSHTKYFNLKNKRAGPLFQGRFKSKRVETKQQLLHLSRYIHLNPYSSYLIKEKSDLVNYAFSSFPEYLGRVGKKLCSKEDVLESFKTLNDYKKFVFNNADYQKRLQEIKHLLFEA
jgi:putative transposase